MNIMKILQRIRAKDPELIILMITHRMHLNNFADKIVLMSKDGSLEEGIHKDLIHRNDSRYYKLWKKFCEKVNIEYN